MLKKQQSHKQQIQYLRSLVAILALSTLWFAVTAWRLAGEERYWEERNSLTYDKMITEKQVLAKCKQDTGWLEGFSGTDNFDVL